MLNDQISGITQDTLPSLQYVCKQQNSHLVLQDFLCAFFVLSACIIPSTSCPFFFSCAPSFDFVLSFLTDLCMQAAVEAPCSAPLTGSGSKVETSVNLLAYSDLE